MLNTFSCGLPQSRSRLYVIGIRADVQQHEFSFPGDVDPMELRELLDPPVPSDSWKRLPPPSQRLARSNVQAALKHKGTLKLLKDGSALILDVDASAGWCWKAREVCPCLTRSSARGLWLLSHGRRLSLGETSRLQGLFSGSVAWPGPDSAGRQFLGNSMSMCVIQRLILHALRAVGRDHGVADPWLTGAAQASLKAGASGSRLVRHDGRQPSRQSASVPVACAT